MKIYTFKCHNAFVDLSNAFICVVADNEKDAVRKVKNFDWHYSEAVEYCIELDPIGIDDKDIIEIEEEE